MEINNILTTGGKGFLGDIVTENLKQRSFNVEDIQETSTAKIDISSPFVLNSARQADIVVHLAGKAHSIPRGDVEAKSFYEVNYEGTKNLCAAIDERGHKPKAFIFISTVSVYGLNSGELINEEAPLLGDSPYAKSKILAEEFLKKWTAKNGIILGIFRLPLIAGPNPPGNLGAMINGIKKGRYFSIGKGDAKKSIVLADDIAAAIPILAKVGGIYNLTDGYHPSFCELEDVITKSLNKSLPLKVSLSTAKLIARVGDLLGPIAPLNSNKLNKIISTLTFDDQKARDLLGWKPAKVLSKLPEIL